VPALLLFSSVQLECTRKILPKVENLSPAGNQSKDEQIEQLMGVVQTLTEQLAQEKARNEQLVAMPREVAPQTLLHLFHSTPFQLLQEPQKLKLCKLHV